MALIIKTFHGFLHKIQDLADPRTEKLPLVGSVFYPIGLVVFYYYLIHVGGPKFMAKRKPFNLDKILMIYNAFQVVSCLALSISGSLLIANNNKFNWRCSEVDYSHNNEAITVTRMAWCYYMLKVIDLLDTVFFVLRKKSNQKSFLHVYHHGGMVIVGWFGTRYVPGGHVVYFGIVNLFVHSIMYAYYLLAAYDKKYQIKMFRKLITLIQLGQFILLFVIYGQLVLRPSCNFPKIPVCIVLIQLILMIQLFADFYYKAYIKVPESKHVVTNGKSHKSSETLVN